MSRAKIIFDNALELEAGEKMLITCTSFKQMESLRASLYRERVQWQKQSLDGSDIGVTRSSQGGKHILVLEKLAPVPPPVIFDKDGKVKKLVDLTVREEVTESTDDTRITVEFLSDKERQKQLMREDGISEEEIAAYFGEEAKNDNLSQEQT